jgi:hypothetical protein
MASLSTAAVEKSASSATDETTEAKQAEHGTFTKGKHTFLNIYNASDARHYMREMYPTQYFIGDYTAAVALRAIDTLFSNKKKITTTSSSSEQEQQPPVVLELCAGYGLSMGALRTSLPSADIFAMYVPERPALVKDAIAKDKKFFEKALRDDLPPLCAVGVDVADNALNYGKGVGLFDEVICRNFEETENTLQASEVALCSRARLVLATGAFSYITCTTLTKIFEAFKSGKEQPQKKKQKRDEGEAAAAVAAPSTTTTTTDVEEQGPVFCFFPLVATDVTEIIAFFEANGLEVYYKPAAHWLPQRKFMDESEATSMIAAQNKVIAAEGAPGPPPSGKEGFLHATALVAGPPSLNLATLAPQWIDGVKS